MRPARNSCGANVVIALSAIVLISLNITAPFSGWRLIFALPLARVGSLEARYEPSDQRIVVEGILDLNLQGRKPAWFAVIDSHLDASRIERVVELGRLEIQCRHDQASEWVSVRSLSAQETWKPTKYSSLRFELPFEDIESLGGQEYRVRYLPKVPYGIDCATEDAWALHLAFWRRTCRPVLPDDLLLDETTSKSLIWTQHDINKSPADSE